MQYVVTLPDDPAVINAFEQLAHARGYGLQAHVVQPMLICPERELAALQRGVQAVEAGNVVNQATYLARTARGVMGI